MNNPEVVKLADTTDLKSVMTKVMSEFKSRLPDQLIFNISKHVKLENECLIWTGALTKSTGYGKIKWKYKSYDVHRLIGLIAFEAIFEEKVEICHIIECPNRACIRLIHLYKGTRSSNMKDAAQKGTLNVQNGPSHFNGDGRVQINGIRHKF